MTRAISSVVFDLGGVLIDWNPEYLYRTLIPDDTERAYFLTQVCTRTWHERHDAGVSFADNAQELLEKYHGDTRMQTFIYAWGARFGEMLNGTIDGTVDILSDLHRRGIPIYALTNWPSEAFGPAKKRFPFLSWFKDTIVSGEEHIKKPDPALYETLLKRTGIDAGSSLYIDDREENLVPARALGFQTILFTTPDALVTELGQYNFPSLQKRYAS